MRSIKLLDCTLRDGGYINNWEFGKHAIKDIKGQLEDSGAEIIELGFSRDEKYSNKRTIFNNIEQIKRIIGLKRPNVQYAVMAEVSNPYPLEKLPQATSVGPDIIRVIVWKSMIKEGFEYCKGIVEKGYKLCVQPARVSQYTDEEFIDMIKLFNELNPLAIYVVDSWGTMYKDELLHYLNLANQYMKPGISVGYHGHNNMMQAFEVACAFCEQDMDRDLIVDASVYGIGRGAGNLNTELFAKWMNEKRGCKYNLNTFNVIFEKYISEIYNKTKWGFSVPYLITAKYNCNPNYASYYEENGLTAVQIEACVSQMDAKERIIFKKDVANKYIKLNKNSRKYNQSQTEIDKIKITDFERKVNCFDLTKDIKSNLIYQEENVAQNPEITIFIPTYKRADLLKEAIDSVINQKPVDFEWDLIVVDNEPFDGSQNETERLVRSYNSGRIRYYRNDQNLRVGDNFNRGIYLAKAPWVMMLHDDDMLIPNALEKMAKSISFLSKQKGKPLGAVATNAVRFFYDPNKPDAHRKNIEEWSNKFLYKWSMSGKFFKLTHLNVFMTGHIGGSVPTCGAAYNRQATIETGGFNDDLGISADLVLYYNMENKYSVYSTLEEYGFYRWGMNQMSKKENTYRTIKDNFDFREYIFNKNIVNKIWGFFFRDVLYYLFTDCVLDMRKLVSNEYVEFKDYASIHNTKPSAVSSFIFRKIIQRIYFVQKSIEKKTLKARAKKYFKKYDLKHNIVSAVKPVVGVNEKECTVSESGAQIQ